MVLDGGAYVGWLLRANRRFGQASELRTGRTFAAAFRSRLAPSHVTRWESGDLLVSRATVRRYEHLLGIEPESLVTVRDAVYRNLPPDRSPPSSPVEIADGPLHDLIDLATSDDPLTGRQWGTLTELIAARPGLILHPPRLWSSMARKLLDELTVHQGTDWLQRQEAASRLVEHPVAGPHVIRACIELVEDPDSPAVIEPLALLDVTSDPVANAYVLRELESPHDERRYRGALLATLRKVSYGHFNDDEAVRLSRAVRGMSGPGEVGRLLDEARALLTPAAAAAGPRFPLDGPRFPSDGPRFPSDGWRFPSTGRRVAETAAALLGDEDGATAALASLVTQTLGSRPTDQRVVAAMTIAHSPYRDPVATALLTDVRHALARRTGEDLSPALQAMTLLGSDVHRPVLYDLLAAPGHRKPAVREAAAWALPHCAGTFAATQWEHVLARQIAAWRAQPVQVNESVLHGVTYGLGTDDQPALLARLTVEPGLPAIVRTTATWLGASP